MHVQTKLCGSVDCPSNGREPRELCIRNILDERFESLGGFSHADYDGCGSREQGMGGVVYYGVFIEMDHSMIRIQRKDTHPGSMTPVCPVLVYHIPSNSFSAPRHPRSTELSFNLPRGFTMHTHQPRASALIMGWRCAFATFGDSLVRGVLETCNSRVWWCNCQCYVSRSHG